MNARAVSKIGPLLCEYRQKAGLSQKDVADALGYSTAQVVSDWERGVRSPPGSIVNKLIKLYSLPVETLYDALLEDQTQMLEKKLQRMLGVKIS